MVLKLNKLMLIQSLFYMFHFLSFIENSWISFKERRYNSSEIDNTPTNACKDKYNHCCCNICCTKLCILTFLQEVESNNSVYNILNLKHVTKTFLITPALKLICNSFHIFHIFIRKDHIVKNLYLSNIWIYANQSNATHSS